MSVFSAKSKFPVQEWQIKSSKSDDIWRIGLWSDHRLSCTCPSFTFKGRSFCKHTQAKRLELESLYGNLHNYLLKLKEDKDVRHKVN